jgi:hypothetical protein
MTMGSTIAPPDEIIAQRKARLQSANRIRIGRSTMLKHIGDLSPSEGLLEAAEAVEDTPDVLLSLQTVDLLFAVRGVGVKGALSLLRRTGRTLYGPTGPPLSGYLPLGMLTDRQREALAEVLRQRAEKVGG